MLLHINEQLSCWRFVTEFLAAEKEEFWSGSSCSDGALVRSEVIFHPTSSPTHAQRTVYRCIWSMQRHEAPISAALAPLLHALRCTVVFTQTHTSKRRKPWRRILRPSQNTKVCWSIQTAWETAAADVCRTARACFEHNDIIKVWKEGAVKYNLIRNWRFQTDVLRAVSKAPANHAVSPAHSVN